MGTDKKTIFVPQKTTMEALIHIKRSILFIAILCLCFNSYGQKKDFDFGILLGTMQYNGDVNMRSPYYSPQPAFGGIFRKNFNPHYSLRLGATFGNLAANDEDFDNGYQSKRAFFFDDTKIMEASAMLEFNFFEVTNNKKEKNFSPFVVFGIGALYLENIKWYEAFNIAQGLGLKYKLLPRLELRGEWVFRKTFTDKLDQLAYHANDGYLHYKQISFQKTNDWFSVLGISLLFNFSDEKIPCPIYELRKYDNSNKRRY